MASGTHGSCFMSDAAKFQLSTNYEVYQSFVSNVQSIQSDISEIESDQLDFEWLCEHSYDVTQILDDDNDYRLTMENYFSAMPNEYFY